MSGCEKLETLECCNNRVSMTKLDASGCTALSSLSCYRNQLTSLDVSSCTKLTDLDCSSNDLTKLDLSKNTALTDLDCSSNDLTTLDLSENKALELLWVYGNDLTTLDLSHNTELQNLDCSGQSVRLEVVRGADETWSADLAALVAGWKEHFGACGWRWCAARTKHGRRTSRRWWPGGKSILKPLQ